MDKRPAWIIFFVVFVIGIVVASRIGPAWDEPDNMYSAGVYGQFFTQGFDTTLLAGPEALQSLWKDRIYPLDRFLAHLPPLHNYLGLLFVWVRSLTGVAATSSNIITAFHWSAAFFFALLVATVYRFGRLLNLSTSTAVFAALCTYFYPTLFGHGYSNTKDIAQASMFIVSLYFLVRFSLSSRPESRDPSSKNRIASHPPATPERELWRAGARNDIFVGSVFWGLGLATKFNAVYVPVIWVVWSLFARLRVANENSDPASVRSPRLRAGQAQNSSFTMNSVSAFGASESGQNFVRAPAGKGARYLFYILLFILIALLVFILIWPYMWFDPVGRIAEMLRYFTSVGTGYRVFWNGMMYQVGIGKMLWWYPWANLLLATPPILLVLGITGMVVVFREISDGKSRRLILLVWLILPTLRALLPNATFYDGLRHFVEILPAWCLLAAIGLEKMGGVSRKNRWMPAILIGVLTAHMAGINLMYFPYSTGYFNILAKNPNEHFDRDIEALSVKEAVDYLHKKYGNIRLWSPIGGHLSWYYLPPSDTYVYSAPEADSIVLINKSSHIRQQEFEVQIADLFRLDHVIQRGPALFAWVYRRK